MPHAAHTSTPTCPADEITAIDDLVAFWDFAEPAGSPRVSRGGAYVLHEQGEAIGRAQPIERVSGGPISGFAAKLTGREFFRLAAQDTRRLNIHGPDAQVTVVAWIKRAHKKPFPNARGQQEQSCEFVAGMWNEGDQTRQYGLYLDLPMYGGKDQVIGHVSDDGDTTPGYPYSRDYSASLTPVPCDRWSAVGFTYDGCWVRSYIDGVMEERPAFTDQQGQTYAKNPYHFPHGLYPGDGPNGVADFTVGAVTWRGVIHNRLVGLMGGVAVYERALGEAEMAALVFPPR